MLGMMNDDERTRRIQAHYARLARQTQSAIPFWFEAYTAETTALAQAGYTTLAQPEPPE